jgi:hypothetical protein
MLAQPVHGSRNSPRRVKMLRVDEFIEFPRIIGA